MCGRNKSVVKEFFGCFSSWWFSIMVKWPKKNMLLNDSVRSSSLGSSLGSSFTAVADPWADPWGTVGGGLAQEALPMQVLR